MQSKDTYILSATRDELVIQIKALNLNSNGQYFWKAEDWDWSLKEIQKNIRTLTITIRIFQVLGAIILPGTLIVPFIPGQGWHLLVDNLIIIYSLFMLYCHFRKRMNKFSHCFSLVKVLKITEK